MANLYFQSAQFLKGHNISIRRGVKWDTTSHTDVHIIDARNPLKEDGSDRVVDVVDITTQVFRFSDLKHFDLSYEHDPDCRDYKGLLDSMCQVYPGFSENEIVTVVSFDIARM